MNEAQQTERLLTTAEAAKIMGIDKRALDRLRGAGRGPVYTRVGRYVRYSRKHVYAYLEARAVVPSG